MSENSLKPCPLCGVIDAFVYTETIPLVGGDSYDVGVVDCVSGECPMIIRAPTEEEAIKKWNKRPIEETLQIKLDMVCLAIKESFNYFPNAKSINLLKETLEKIGYKND